MVNGWMKMIGEYYQLLQNNKAWQFLWTWIKAHVKGDSLLFKWRVMALLICLFFFFAPLENFSLIWRNHHYQWRTTKFDLCWALMAIAQWESFNGLVTLTLVAEYLQSRAVTTCLTTWVCLNQESNPNLLTLDWWSNPNLP